MNAFGRALSSVVETGKEILARRRLAATQSEAAATALTELCRELLEHRGEASGLALASEIASGYLALAESDRGEFFQSLLTEFDVDDDRIFAATQAYREDSNPEALAAIVKAVEAPRQKLFRRINMAPDGTTRHPGHIARSLARGAEKKSRPAGSGLRPSPPVYFLVQQRLSGNVAH